MIGDEKLPFYLVVFFCYFTVVYCLYADHVACEQGFGGCRCEFPDGYGIDMKMLRAVKFAYNSTDGTDVQYNLRVCWNEKFVNSTTNCTSTSLFIVKYDGPNITECEDLGGSFQSKIIWMRKADVPYLEYTKGNTISHVELVCDAYKSEFMFLEHSDNLYRFRLKSKEVCGEKLPPVGKSSGMNVILILLIVILVLFLLYMIGGMVVLKFIRGAEGLEIIPNHEFWISIPTRMKNGLIFCVNGCKDPPTYDRI